MAVTVEGTPSSGVTVGTTTLTFAHTTGATATGLFVGVGSCNGGNAVSSVTFNGDALTELWDLNDGFVLGRCAGYLMVNPDIGTYNVVVTVASASDFSAGAVGLAGLETSSVGAAHRTVYTAQAGGGGAAGGPTITVVDSQSGDLVIDSPITFNGTIVAGAGQTSQCEDDAIAGNNFSWGVSTESAAGASTVMSWATGDYWATGATALIAAGGGGSTWGPLLGMQNNRLVM